MLQVLGKFTVEWNKRGRVYYGHWFSRSTDYFKCVKTLQGSKVATHNDDDYGIVTDEEYILFLPPGTVDKTTQKQFLELPEPFFVSQFLAQDAKGSHPPVYREVRKIFTYPNENFMFSETESK